MTRIKFRPPHKRAMWGTLRAENGGVLTVVTANGFYSVPEADVIERKEESDE